MRYLYFIVKKIYRNWLHIIPFLFITAFLIVIYLGNRAGGYHSIKNPAFSGESEVEAIQKDILIFQEELTKYDVSSIEYQDSIDNLDIAQRRLKYLQQRLEAIKNEDWKSYYEGDLELTKIILEVANLSVTPFEDDFMESLRLDQDYTQYMIDHELSYDERFLPFQGISYMSHAMKDYMPLILGFLLTFIASTLYCSSYIDDMNIHHLIPISSLKKQGLKLLAGVIVGCFIVMIITTICIALGTFGNTLGNMQSPILSYTLKGAHQYIPFMSILPQLCVLLVLSIVFLVQLVSVISIFVKKNLTCFMIAIIIVAGGIWIIENIVPIFPIAHLLPTTYLSSFKVVSGELLFVTSNTNVNVMNGMLVLSISNMILFLLYAKIAKMYSRGGVKL